MMGSTASRGFSRRALLVWCALLGSAIAIPARVWAALKRPTTAFGATALDQAFEELGSIPAVHEGIRFTTPDIAENGAVVPIKIEVDAQTLPNVTKVYVLVEKNPNPMVAAFYIPDDTDVYVVTRVKVAQTSSLFAVVEAEGKLFMQSKETKVTLGGCGG